MGKFGRDLPGLGPWSEPTELRQSPPSIKEQSDSRNVTSSCEKREELKTEYGKVISNSKLSAEKKERLIKEVEKILKSVRPEPIENILKGIQKEMKNLGKATTEMAANNISEKIIKMLKQTTG